MKRQLELDFSQPRARATEAPEAQPVFLDWRAPALESAADWLLGKAPAHDRVTDLQRFIVCLPTARAGRRLLEALVDRAEAKHRGLLPPAIVTLGSLAELLYVCDRPVASEEQRLLAWAEAVRASDVRVLTGGEAPEAAAGRALANAFVALEDELAAARLAFSDVCEVSGDDDPSRRERWALLQSIADLAREHLAAAGLIDRLAARETALKAGAVRCERDIVLVACVDVPPFLHAMLTALGSQVTPLVFAPDRMRERFDALGALRTKPWLHAGIAVSDDAIAFCASAREQGAAVRDAIAALEDDLALDDVTVCVLDDEVIAPIESELAEEGIAVHLGTPRPFATSAVARLLLATRDYLRDQAMRAFAVWARHPDVERKLHMAEALLPAIDGLRAEHFVERFRPPFLGRPSERGVLLDLYGRAFDLLGPLAHEDKAPLCVWAAEIVRFVARVYGSRRLSREHPGERALLDALEALMATCERLAQKNRLTERAMTAADALDWVCFVLADAALAPPPVDVAIEVVGWLDVLLDAAPALIVTSMNDGFVPEAVNADAFLPNGLRARLPGVVDNDRRHARDAYVLSAALATKRVLSFTVGSRTLVGDPLLPSRLLLACDPETAARRLKAFTGHARPAPVLDDRRGVRIVVPEPVVTRPVTAMRVSAFRTYLACPYRFYLRHVCGLRAVEDERHELNAAQFGSLAHLVLCDFAKSDAREATDAQPIRLALESALRTRTHELFGDEVPIAIRLQLRQLGDRFKQFAAWQARWADQGWRIAHQELPFKGTTASIVVDGEPMYLTGTIDRVDEHKDGRVMIFDYKTSDKPKPPDLVHRKKGAWQDLQLPLYRRLWRSTGDTRPLTLAYLNIAPTAHETSELPAAWTNEELQEADALSESIVRAVRRGEFPMRTPPPKFFEEFAAICQDGQLSNDDEEDE